MKLRYILICFLIGLFFDNIKTLTASENSSSDKFIIKIKTNNRFKALKIYNSFRDKGYKIELKEIIKDDSY